MSTYNHTRRSLNSLSIGFAVLWGAVIDAQAQLHFGEPENLGPVVNSSSNDMGPRISADGLTLFFFSGRPGGFGSWDFWMTTRISASDPWQPPENLGPVVNSEDWDAQCDISADGLSLFFGSGRPGGLGSGDIWVTTRASVSDSWETPVNLGPPVNGEHHESGPNLSADGLTLYFDSDRPSGSGERDLWMTSRDSVSHPWQEPVNLGPVVNSPNSDAVASISTDGLMLFFWSDRPEGGCLNRDIWVTMRPSTSDPWGAPIELPFPVNIPNECDGTPDISADGRMLYFSSTRNNSYPAWDLWQVAVFPCHGDLNRDGEVGLADLAQLLGSYGETSGQAYGDGDLDGDGDVDLADLAELLGVYGEPCP